MTESLNEINRLLYTVAQLSSGRRGAPESAVVNICKSVVYDLGVRDHTQTIDLGSRLGLVTRSQGRVEMTPIGIQVAALNSDLRYEMNPRQKDIIVRECILGGPYVSETTGIIRQFKRAYKSRTYLWTSSDDPPLDGDPSYIGLLGQTGLLERNGRRLRVAPPYVRLVAQLLGSEAKTMTLAQLATKLKAASEIGEIAEEIAFKFEKERLSRNGHTIESECVELRSELDVGAGYDIASFNGRNNKLVFDRFIEVKGSAGDHVEFYWSRNEVEKAKDLGKRYWIYFVGGVNRETRKSKREPALIRSPYPKIFKGSEYDVTTEQYWVSMK